MYLSQHPHPAHLCASKSFSGIPSQPHHAASLKRRYSDTDELSRDPPFFNTVETTFHSHSYTLNDAQPEMTRQSSSTSHRRSNPNYHAPPPPDVDLDDPTALFVRPPFTNFPDAHRHPDGLTFALLERNPEWFLVASDFVQEEVADPNPNAIPYPPQLEPPKGWNPEVKKLMKEQYPDGWQKEDEIPKLRCLFCRRAYLGPNAKSMWRRHVWEKHHIAMSNRRKNAERGRGRISNKENKRKERRRSSSDEDGLTFVKTPNHGSSPVTLDDFMNGRVTSDRDYRNHAPLTMGQSAAHRYPDHVRTTSTGRTRTRTMQDDYLDRMAERKAAAASRRSPEPEPEAGSDSEPEAKNEPMTPPLKARSLSPDDVPQLSFSQYEEHEQFPSHVELSPYNPARTPCAVHIPPRLPSDHPWRFDASTPPLYSADVRDLYLTKLALPEEPSSPTPANDFEVCDVFGTRALLGLSTPSKRRSGSTYGRLMSPFSSPRGAKLGSPSPFTRIAYGDTSRRIERAQSPSPSLRRSYAVGDLSEPIHLGSDDLFSKLYPWAEQDTMLGVGSFDLVSPDSSPVPDSPVLRSTTLQGVSLLPPMLLDEDNDDEVGESDFELMYSSSDDEKQEARLENKNKGKQESGDALEPPSKRVKRA